MFSKLISQTSLILGLLLAFSKTANAEFFIHQPTDGSTLDPGYIELGVYVTEEAGFTYSNKISASIANVHANMTIFEDYAFTPDEVTPSEESSPNIYYLAPMSADLPADIYTLSVGYALTPKDSSDVTYGEKFVTVTVTDGTSPTSVSDSDSDSDFDSDSGLASNSIYRSLTPSATATGDQQVAGAASLSIGMLPHVIIAFSAIAGIGFFI